MRATVPAKCSRTMLAPRTVAPIKAMTRTARRIPAPNLRAEGACCSVNGSCQVLTSAACTAAAGNYQGDNTVCSPNPCPQPPASGACCAEDATCQVRGSGHHGHTGGGVPHSGGLHGLHTDRHQNRPGAGALSTRDAGRIEADPLPALHEVPETSVVVEAVVVTAAWPEQPPTEAGDPGGCRSRLEMTGLQ